MIFFFHVVVRKFIFAYNSACKQKLTKNKKSPVAIHTDIIIYILT